MRFVFAFVTIAATVAAQSPLTTTFANNNGGSVGGAIYFELECLDPLGVAITSIDLNFDGPGGLSGSIDVYMQADGLLQDWAGPICSGNVGSSAPAGTPTTVGLAPTLQLGFGCKTNIAIVANGLAHAYTNGGGGLPSTYSTAELELTVGGASNVPFTGPLFSPRIANISIPYFAGGNCPDIASVSSQGDGCVATYTSFYELLTPVAFDLSGLRLTATPNGQGGFDVDTAPGTVLPVGSLGTPTALALGDDSQVAAGTLGLTVGSNCWVAFGGGNSNAFTPNVATLLANPSTGIYSWNDLNPAAAGSGQVQYEEASGTALITYDGVFAFGSTTPSTVQFFVDTNNGSFTVTWGALAATTNVLVGYSAGGPSADPGPTDLSSLTAPNVLSTAGADQLPLALVPVGRPIQGLAPTPFMVTTENIPPGALSQIGIFGLTRPGLPLDGIGLPDCFLNASLDVLSFVLLPASQPSYTWTAVTLPSIGPFRRVYHFNLQSVVFGTSANSFLGLGAVTSNGLKCRTGKL